MTAQGLGRSLRITRTAELRAIMNQGKRRRTDHLDLFALPSSGPRSRLAVVVPRAGHTAVQRNGLRRRLREIARRGVLPVLAPPADLLVRARAEAYGADFETLRREIVGTLCRSSRDSASS